MSDSFLSPFQLLGSSIESISFEVVDSSPKSNSTSLSLGHYVSKNELRKDGIWAIKGGISVECAWQDSNGDDICWASCEMRGAVSVFESAFKDDFSEGELELLLHANLISLLYGEVRSLLEILSARSSVGRIMLPSIDPFEYLDSE